jgi:PAS domain S-box-containing protein
MIKPKKKAEESRNSYKSFMFASPISITLLDLNGKIVETNEALEKLTGYKKAEIIGKNFLELPSVSNTKILIPRLKLFEKIQNGEIIGPTDIPIRKKNGEVVWISIIASLLKRKENTSIQVFAQDIDQRKREEQVLKESKELFKKENKKLKELEEMRKEFIDIAAHELKTPLTSVHSAAQLLNEFYKEKMSDDKNFMDLVNIINSGCERIQNLVENLLDFSRMESKDDILHFQECDFVQIINNCVVALNALLNKREQELILKNIPEKLIVTVDEIKIERVLINLISNAIKFTPVKGKITIKLEEKENCIEFSICDTGIGIKKSDMDKLFKKFSRIHNGNISTIDSEGTGLGLYLSKGIIELHGGKIWAESKGKNKGSTFFIRVPSKR